MMISIPLNRAGGGKIRNELFERGGAGLGIVLSGFGYGYGMPLLYYSRKVLETMGYDCWCLDYEYFRDADFLALPEAGQDARFAEDNASVFAALEGLLVSYEKSIFVGKSLGTTIMHEYIEAKGVSPSSAYVMLTPGQAWPAIIASQTDYRKRVLAVGSLRDPAWAVRNLTDLRSRDDLEVFELAEGDHFLETGEVAADLETLARVMQRVRTFVETIH